MDNVGIISSKTHEIKKKSSYAFKALLCCIAVFTISQFLPVYFTNVDLKNSYYLLTIVSLSFLIGLTIYNRFFKPSSSNILITIYSFVFGSVACFLMLTVFVLLGISEWKISATYFINKHHPETKITRRYLDEGALGGGSRAEDYHLVKEQPITPWFRLETNIDTNTLNREDWIKVAIDPGNWTEKIK